MGNWFKTTVLFAAILALFGSAVILGRRLLRRFRTQNVGPEAFGLAGEGRVARRLALAQ